MSNTAYRAAALLVGTLARLGLRHACVTPGSRNTPLTLAFAEHPSVTDWIHHDERSSSFFALGLAKATRAPVAVVTTSGTAAAELLPAVVEARYGATPLLLLTADRPPELRAIGAPQTIDQVGLFGSNVGMTRDLMLGDMDTDAIVRLAAFTWETASRHPAGPVHLNLGFREPLVPTDLSLPEPPSLDRPQAAEPAVDESSLRAVAKILGNKRVLVAAGPSDGIDSVHAVVDLARRAGWPIMADPLSQLRAGEHDRSNVISSGDALFRSGRIPGMPEAVLRIGAPLTSKAFSTWLQAHPEVPQVAVDDVPGRDPTMTAQLLINTDPVWISELAVEPIGRAWSESWQRADTAAARALAGSPFPSEPAVVQQLADGLPANSNLYIASSMPIRDVDLFFPSIERPIRFMANRGANGIDGLISSALGAAATGTRTFALAGDLSMLHDMNALATAVRLRLPLTVIVVNNDGGGIFSFLPQAGLPRHFERVFSTPHGISFVPVADALGLRAELIEHPDDFAAALAESGPSLLEVRTDRKQNVTLHEEALARVELSLS